MFIYLKSLLVFIKSFSIIKMRSGQRVQEKQRTIDENKLFTYFHVLWFRFFWHSYDFNVQQTQTHKKWIHNTLKI